VPTVLMKVNGANVSGVVESRALLVQFLRETLGMTGTHVGCDTSQCGPCCVLMNGHSIKSYSLLAVQAEGAEITTIEGLATGDKLHPMQKAFRQNHGLHSFNNDWSRRVLGQGAVVFLITDGLDREDGQGLGGEMERLHKPCRKLIWLNPLLRYERFEPRALGVRTILPHVDEFLRVHNLANLADLARVLGREAVA
jgi:hypothetical protein